MPMIHRLLAALLIWKTVNAITFTDFVSQNSRLELVQVLFRNGERTPYVDETYPRNPYSNSLYFEPWGHGQLLEIGRLRANRLGSALRRQYNDFLAELYKPDEVYAYSVDRDSNREALQLLLKSLFRIDERASLRIHSMPEDIDMLMNSRACSRYKELLDKVRRTSEIEKKLAKYEGLYKYIKEKAGITFDKVNNDEILYKLYNLLEAQRSMNLTLPDWCPEGVLGLLNEITFLHYNIESYTDDLRRLNGGPLVRRFLDSAVRSSTSRLATKIHLYSGEDHNVAAFARALNKRFPRVPNYGSAIIVEKHRSNESGKVFVRIMIWTGVSEKLFPIQLKGCMEMCPLEEYVRIVSASLPSDVEMRCLFDDLRNHRYERIITY